MGELLTRREREEQAALQADREQRIRDADPFLFTMMERLNKPYKLTLYNQDKKPMRTINRPKGCEARITFLRDRRTTLSSLADKRVIVIRDEARKQRAIMAIEGIHASTLDPPEKIYEVIIQEHHSTRSLAQNRLLWWWYKHIRTHVFATEGKFYSDIQFHHYFCEMFLPQVVEEMLGKVVKRQRTSSELNVKEFTEFLTKIEQYAFDVLHFVLPRPEDMYNMAMGKSA